MAAHQVPLSLGFSRQEQCSGLPFPSSEFELQFPIVSDGKESACNAKDPGSIPGSGRSLGEGNGQGWTHTHTHTHTQECYSAIKKTRAMTFAWMSWIELIEIT